MPVLNTSSDTMPDKVPGVPAGEYVFKILDVTVEDGKDRNEGKKVVVCKLQVDMDGNPQHGRLVFDRMPLSGDPKNPEFGDISLKKIQKSAGLIPAASLDTDTLIDKHVKATIKVSTGQKDGVTQEYSNIKEYLY